MIKYLDDILSGLRYQEGQYDLVKIHDKEYQDKLRIQSEYWEKLKTEIGEVRSKGYQNTDIVNMSEMYLLQKIIQSTGKRFCWKIWRR